MVGADGKPFVLHFRRPEIVRFEARYLAALRPFAAAVPLSGPVGVTFGYYFPATQEGAADMRRHGVAMRRKTSKPDVDNIGKNLLDCMTRAGFFTDDSAVALIHAEKFEVTGRPRISVRVRQLAEYPGGLFAPVEVEGRRNAQEGRRGSRTGEDSRTGRSAILGPFPWPQSAFPARRRRRRRRIDYDSTAKTPAPVGLSPSTMSETGRDCRNVGGFWG